jgi:hypothetical protein
MWIARLCSAYFVALIAFHSAISANTPHKILENIFVFSLQLVLCIYFLITREHRIFCLCSHHLLWFTLNCLHIVLYVCGFLHFLVHIQRTIVWKMYGHWDSISGTSMHLEWRFAPLLLIWLKLCVELYLTFHHRLTIILQLHCLISRWRTQMNEGFKRRLCSWWLVWINVG